MRVSRIELLQFRGFEELTLDLDRPLTLLVGENGAGKSSVLAALEIAAWQFAGMALERPLLEPDFRNRDVRAGAREAQIRLRIGPFDCSMTHITESKLSKFRSSPGCIGARPALPVALSVERSRVKSSMEAREMPRPGVASSAWDDGANPEFTSFEHFEQWFREQEDLENQERVRRRNFELENPGLTAVREILAAVLPDIQAPRIDRNRPGRPNADQTQLTFTKNGVDLTADQLSDGERSLMSWRAPSRGGFRSCPRARGPRSNEKR